MLMPVMQIRPVRMTVRDWFMRMTVRVARRGVKSIVGVRVMSVIVRMRVLVLDFIVRVVMFMLLAVLQKQENRHDQHPNGNYM